MLIRGLHNQPIIKELAHKFHPKPNTFQFQNISDTALLAEQARIKNGSIVIPNGEGVYCDVKVVPNYDEGNANRICCSDRLTFGDTIELEGKIIDDRKSLSYPGSYVIQTFHGPILIVSNCYEHIGSACEGDRVKCRGIEFTTDSGEKGIMLTKTQYEPDGDTHFIVI